MKTNDEIIAELPQSITRETYLALIRGAGFGEQRLRSLEFRTDGIHAEVMASTGKGGIAVDTLTDTVMTHRIYIPVKD